MKSLKYIFSIVSIILLISCSNNETEENVFTVDSDRDGVTNYQESLDNTDPNDPCSLKTTSQYSPAISSEWKLMDCDGDGVNNEQELADGTYMLDPMYDLCDYVTEHQDLSMVSDFWKSVDCDGDGVSNQQEIIDQTDLKDSCDFLSASQISPSEIWLNLDCDEDGKTNGEEIDAGTDPLDPDSFPGNGTKIVSVKVGNDYQTHLFTNEGTRYDKIVGVNNTLLSDFTYDTQGNLISAFIKDESGNDDITINYTYTNNLVSRVDINEGGELSAFDVVHNGNTISTFEIGGHLPNGIYTSRYTLDPTTNKVLTIEKFYIQSTLTLTQQTETFTYNGPDGDVTRSELTGRTYTIASQTFSNPSDPFFTQSYNYESSEAKNPFYKAGQTIYVNYLLTPIILQKCWVRWHGAFSQNYRNKYSYFYPGNSADFYNRTLIVQNNGFPLTGITNETYGTGIPTDFFYEE